MLIIGGMMAAALIDCFVKAHPQKRGLPVSSRISISHVLIHNPQTGCDLRLEVNEQNAA